jgi:shikimate 5-dehydrogenase
LGWQISLAARRKEQGIKLVESFDQYAGKMEAISLLPETFQRDYRLIVNTTPLGMPPHENVSPWPVDIVFPQNAVVYDLIYLNNTPLLRAAQAASLRSANGMGMLIEQAALSFEIWTGVDVSREKLWLSVHSNTKQGDQ